MKIINLAVDSMDKIKKRDLDLLYDYLDEENSNDFAKTRCTFSKQEIIVLKKSHDFWENATLKAWSKRFREKRIKEEGSKNWTA